MDVPRESGRVRGTWIARIVVAAAVLFTAAVASGQMELAVITGTVTDENGTPLEGVSFRLKDADRGTEVVFQSNKDGQFYRRGLKATEYDFIVEKEGYKPIADKLKLSAGRDRRFNFKLAKAAPPGAEEFAQGVEAFKRGDNQAAVAAFEAVAKKAPDAPEVKVNLALAYLRLSRTEDAIAQLEQASALGPDNPEALFQLGGAYVEARKYDKAIAAFEAGLAKDGDLADPLAWEATVTLAAVYFAAGQIDASVASFEKALAARPDQPGPKLGLGKCAFSTGDVARAVDYFQQVVSSAPGTPEAAEAAEFLKAIK